MRMINDDGTFSRELFIFLKYNQLPPNEIKKLHEHEEDIYKEFLKKISKFNTAFKEGDGSASEILGSTLSMFGFNRHYCSISGKPIIGKYQKIGGKIVSQESYESYKIIQQMEKKRKDSLSGSEQGV